MMYIFGFIVVHEAFGGSSYLTDLLQPFENADEFVCGENSGVSKGAGMGAARDEFIAQQTAVEVKRPLPMFKLRIQRLPEPARPHLHRRTSTRARARVREGSPRMR